MEFIVFKRKFRISYPVFSAFYMLVLGFMIFYLLLSLNALRNGNPDLAIGMCFKGILAATVFIILYTAKYFLGIKIFEEYWTKNIFSKKR